MHMADALVAPAVAATMYVCSGGAAGFSVKKVRLESDPKKIPVMGVMGAFVFAAQMINFTIPGTGSSGHLCGGMMLTALLGPYAAFLTMWRWKRSHPVSQTCHSPYLWQRCSRSIWQLGW